MKHAKNRILCAILAGALSVCAHPLTASAQEISAQDANSKQKKRLL